MAKLSELLKQFEYIDPSILEKVAELEDSGQLTPELAKEMLAVCQQAEPQLKQLRLEELQTIDELHTALLGQMKKEEKVIRKTAENIETNIDEQTEKDLLSDIEQL